MRCPRSRRPSHVLSHVPVRQTATPAAPRSPLLLLSSLLLRFRRFVAPRWMLISRSTLPRASSSKLHPKLLPTVLRFQFGVGEKWSTSCRAQVSLTAPLGPGFFFVQRLRHGSPLRWRPARVNPTHKHARPRVESQEAGRCKTKKEEERRGCKSGRRRSLDPFWTHTAKPRVRCALPR